MNIANLSTKLLTISKIIYSYINHQQLAIKVLRIFILIILLSNIRIITTFAIDTPVLQAPANNSLITPINETGSIVSAPVAIPEFIWKSVDGATSYRIQFSQDIGFTTKIEFTTPHTHYIPTDISRFNDGIWYWRVRVEAPTVGFFSEPYQFTKDWASEHNFPVLIQPANEAVLDFFSSPNFSWQPVMGAGAYRFQIASNPDFTNPQINITTIYTTYQPPLKVANGVYYWRVIPIDPANREGTYSEVRQFTMAYNYIPELLEPANDSNPTFTPTFRWKAVKGAQTYELQYSTDPSFNSNLTPISTKNTTYTPQNAMPNDVDFYWRVRAISGSSISDWSEIRHFVKKWYILPVLLTPTNLYQYVSYPLYNWTPVPGASYYKIEIDDNINFTSPIIHLTANPFFAGECYSLTYWRVTPYDGNNNSGKHSGTASFNCSNDSNAPNQIYPLYYYPPNTFPDSFSSYSMNPYEDRTVPYPIFLWNRVTSASNGATVAPAYRIQVDDDPLFQSIDWQIDTENLSATPTTDHPFTPTINKDYYWRVCPLDHLGGNCLTTTIPVSGLLWSQKWRTRFDNTRGLPATNGSPQLLRPVDSYEYVEMTPLFEWMPIQNASSYEIQISNNETFTEIVDTNKVPYPAYSPTNVIAQRELLNRLNYGTYYWRVRAQTPSGYTSWSETRRFQIAAQSLWRETRTLGNVENRQQIANDPDDTIDDNFELTNLYATQDKDNWYFGFNAVLAGDDMVYVLYLDTDHLNNSGATFDARGYSITTIPAHQPEFAIYYFQQSNSLSSDRIVIYDWTGSAWTNNPKTLQEIGGALYIDVDHNYVEIKIPNTAIGMQTDTGSYSLALFSLPANGSPIDSVPTDPNVPGSGVISHFTSVSERMMPRMLPNNLGGDPTTFPSITPFFWDYPAGENIPWKGYRLEVHLDKKFTTLISSGVRDIQFSKYTSPTFTSWEKDLIGDNTYYWRIRPAYELLSHSIIYGVWSQAMSFKRVGFVAQNLSESVVFATPTFSWDMVEGAESYDLQVDNDPNFGSTEININTKQNSYTPTSTLANGTYYWRVKVRRNGGIANDWSSVKSFTLALPKPTNLSPVNEAIVDRAPTFCWDALIAKDQSGNPVLAAYKYKIQVSRGDSTFSSIYDSIETEQTCWTPSKGYDDGNYYWRIAMIDGQGRVGEFTSALKFTKQYPITTLLEPAPGSTSNGTPKFVWTPVNGAAAYRFEVSISPTFAPLYDSVTTNNVIYMPTKKYSDNTYYWRVAIIDKDGKLGPFNDAIILVKSGYKIFLPYIKK